MGLEDLDDLDILEGEVYEVEDGVVDDIEEIAFDAF